MKLLVSFLALIFCFNLSAQQKESSLQTSLKKALNQDKSKVTNFEANVNLAQKAVQLKWKSSTNSSTTEYIIEKSADKMNWKIVASVYGANHRSHEIEFVHMDFQPFESMSYYRLIQKDKGGKELFSNVVPVKYYTSEYNTGGINLYPVVTENDSVINITFEDIFEKEILLVIRDNKGNEFYSKVLINIEEEELVAVPVENEIPSGDYLITATSENQIYSQNIVIK